MTGNVRAWLDGESEHLTWIEFDAYAKRVFARGSPEWRTVANVFVGGLSQAQGVVRSAVLSIDLLAPLATNTDGQSTLSMLQAGGASEYLVDVVDALAHQFADTTDLVLKLATPGDVLRQHDAGVEPTFDDLDDLAIAQSNLLREFSTKPISGILLSGSQALSADESEALESVVSVARHYGWWIALALDASDPVDSPTDLDIDLFLQPAISLANIPTTTESRVAVGGGLDDTFWQNEASVDRGARALLYGTIPPETQPELVIKRIAALAN